MSLFTKGLGKSINLDSFEPLVKISVECGVKRFIYASSSSVYGVKKEKDVHEGMELEPLTDYSKYKANCEEILSSCIRHGGTLSGEHGIGLEKADWMTELYSNDSLKNMQNIRTFFNPENLLNPGKLFPQPGRCAESKNGNSPKETAVLDKIFGF